MCIKLSICIPTYNRLNYIKLCLESIFDARKGYEDEVEIIVSNNASTDSTDDYLKSIKEKNFRYYRNEENLGFNRNLFLLVDQYAVGEYVWTIGDDDYVSIDSIKLFFSLPKGFNVLLMKYIVIEEHSRIDNCKKQRDLSINESAYNVAIDKIADFGNLLATFMSCAIFKKIYFNKIDKRSILDNDWISFSKVFPNGYLLFNSFSKMQGVFWTNEPFVFVVNRKKEWDDAMRILCSYTLPMFYFYVRGNSKIRYLPNTSFMLYKHLLKALLFDNSIKKFAVIVRILKMNPIINTYKLFVELMKRKHKSE